MKSTGKGKWQTQSELMIQTNEAWSRGPLDHADKTPIGLIKSKAMLILQHKSGATAWLYEARDLAKVANVEPPLAEEAKVLLLETAPGPQARADALKDLVTLPDLPKPLFVALNEDTAEGLAAALQLRSSNIRRLVWRRESKRLETRLVPLAPASESDDLAALQRSLSQHPGRFEGENTGHLEGRAKWFSRRRGRTDQR